MSVPYFFGYGSLVNRDTHRYGGIHTARLQGWRRVWRHTTQQPRPFLTVEPCAETAIDGLIAHVPDGDWSALDLREAGYDRITVTEAVLHPAPMPVSIAIYSVPEGKHDRPSEDLPIALSYVDVVVDGYLREFGEAGAFGFFETTAGWEAPFVDDRHAPRYSRHIPVSHAASAIVDSEMRRLGTPRLKLS